MNVDCSTKPLLHNQPFFLTTHWSVVMAARDDQAPEARQALEALCRAYWYPVYAFIRRCNHGPEDAMDLTQGFFAHMLHKGALGKADPEKGRFRTFLITCVKNYLGDELDKARSGKRGGGQVMISLDAEQAEGRYRYEPADEQSPDRLFERRWALTILEQTLARLRQEYAAEHQATRFERLHGFLFQGPRTLSYAEAAADLAAPEVTVRSWVSRMRQRYGQILRQIVAETVAAPGEVDAELRHLISIVS